MSQSELAQLELLAQVDDLVARLAAWSAVPPGPWGPLARSRALIRRLLKRVELLRIRLETPLVVATFGGTGTGKSALVNAILGEEVTPSGRERPTTREPIVLAHPETDLESFEFPLDEVRVVRKDNPLLRDIVLLDCPDPDTTESETTGSNLERLHHLLPLCDVLIYTSTQQKYRSARVTDELAQAAPGCRLIFVQTHADLDVDVRDDWRKQLSAEYQVADLFFVDSRRAMAEQQAGQKPTGEFGRLLDLLLKELGSSHRVRIRRANLLDLIHGALEHCRRELDEKWPAVQEVRMQAQRLTQQSVERMAANLTEELEAHRGLWERRLLSNVLERRPVSPFSGVLWLYQSAASLLGSYALLRARTPAQMALVGAMQGARMLAEWSDQQRAGQLDRLLPAGFDRAEVEAARIVLAGSLQEAELDPSLLDGSAEKTNAESFQAEFLNEASRQIDAIVQKLAAEKSRWYRWLPYELLFACYWLFLVYRIGRNFFYDSMAHGEPLLSTSFYIPAVLFLVIIGGGLLMRFTRGLSRHLGAEIGQLTRKLASAHLTHGLFEHLSRLAGEIEQDRLRLDGVTQAAANARAQARYTPVLSARLVAPRPQ